MNPRQPRTLTTNPIQNPKNDGHFMAVTTRGGKQTIDPPRLSVVEDDRRKDKEVLEVSGELVDDTVIEVEVSQKVVSIPRPPPPFP